MLVALIVAATEATDELMKERYIANAEQTLQFYQSKILTSRSRERREALAKLISAEDQKIDVGLRGAALRGRTADLRAYKHRSNVAKIGFGPGFGFGVGWICRSSFGSDPFCPASYESCIIMLNFLRFFYLCFSSFLEPVLRVRVWTCSDLCKMIQASKSSSTL